MMATPLLFFGPIKEIQAPPGWSGASPVKRNDMRRWTRFYHQSIDSATINVFYRGCPITVEAAKHFASLMNTTPRPGTRELTDDEKSQCSELLGSQNAGDNQYTNTRCTQESPATFHLDSAKVGWLGKQPAVFVRGRFNYTNPGELNNEFAGVFLPTGMDHSEVYEIFLQTAGLEAFEHCSQDFELTLQSLLMREQ